MKYIMLNIPFGGSVRRTPILFPDYLTHAMVAEALIAQPHLSSATVHSAGEFSSMDLGDVELGGKSTSLGVESDPNDSKFLPLMDYHHGIF